MYIKNMDSGIFLSLQTVLASFAIYSISFIHSVRKSDTAARKKPVMGHFRSARATKSLHLVASLPPAMSVCTRSRMKGELSCLILSA